MPVETATNAAGQVVATATITVDASAATAEVPCSNSFNDRCFLGGRYETDLAAVCAFAPGGARA